MNTRLFMKNDGSITDAPVTPLRVHDVLLVLCSFSGEITRYEVSEGSSAVTIDLFMISSDRDHHPEKPSNHVYESVKQPRIIDTYRPQIPTHDYDYDYDYGSNWHHNRRVCDVVMND